MGATSVRILLADDDFDDRFFFEEALSQLPLDTTLSTVDNGEELIKLLSTEEEPLPHVLFLDLNMHRKSGFECLREIKEILRLDSLPVIIYSTSLDQDIVNSLRAGGAHRYIRKPGDFANLKQVILAGIKSISSEETTTSTEENFVIQVST